MSFTAIIPRSRAPQFRDQLLSSIAQTLSELGYLSALGSIRSSSTMVVAAESGFSDRGHHLVAGSLSLAFDAIAISTLASTMLARSDASVLTRDEREDTTLELVNVATGNLLSRLFGTQREFSLSLPRLRRAPRALESPWVGMRCDSGCIAICFSMD